jgi:antitoxin component YwqK of YwqJK toxin-antitoxin module
VYYESGIISSLWEYGDTQEIYTVTRYDEAGSKESVEEETASGRTITYYYENGKARLFEEYDISGNLTSFVAYDEDGNPR